MTDEREQKIRAKAYELWEAAGRPEGREREHWAEAERLVDAEASPGAATPVKPGKPRRKSSPSVEQAAQEPDPSSPRPRRTVSKRPPG